MTMTTDTDAPPRWVFDESVTRVFDDMLARSIPQYDAMRAACFAVAASFVQPGTAIVDMGCSHGEALAPFVTRYHAENVCVGVDVSAPMLAAARARFAEQIAAGRVEIHALDLRTAFPVCRPSVVLCVLTLQFTPIEYRQQILARIYEALAPGGALVLVEKLLGNTAALNTLLVGHYYEMKRANGYTQEEIDRKRLALEGVLVPVTARWNEELLHGAGFRQVECFWRWMNFAGWVAVRDDK